MSWRDEPTDTPRRVAVPIVFLRSGKFVDRKAKLPLVKMCSVDDIGRTLCSPRRLRSSGVGLVDIVLLAVFVSRDVKYSEVVQSRFSLPAP